MSSFCSLFLDFSALAAISHYVLHALNHLSTAQLGPVAFNTNLASIKLASKVEEASFGCRILHYTLIFM